jgi:aminopeptidase Y
VRRPLLSVLLALAAVAALAPAGARAAAPPVQAAEIDAHLRALSDVAAANGGNRAAGLPGGEATAQYLAGRLAEYGWQVRLEPVRFPMPFDRSAPTLGSAQPGRDFAVVRGSGAGEVTARVRTILSERCNRRALRRLRRGEIALLPFTRCTGEQAARLVARAGGAALIFDSGPDTFPLRFTLMASATIPVVQVRTSVAVRLSRAKGPVHLRVDSGTEPRTASNVVAELPVAGSRRVVMAGGHLDSVPEGAGINDNGTGLAALLEAARRLPSEPRTSTIRLGFWTAEEYGLFGSRAYVAGLPRAERRRIDAYLNFDMVGSPRGVVEVYDSDDAIERLLRRIHPGREGETALEGGISDHDPFDRAGIAVGGIYTGGLERNGRGYRDRCYHRPCDDADNANRDLAARVATTAERALAELSR